MEEKIFTELSLQRRRQALDIMGRFPPQTKDGARGRRECPGRKPRPHGSAGHWEQPRSRPAVCSRLLHPPEFLQLFSPCPKSRKKRGQRRKAGSAHPPEPGPGFGFGRGSFPGAPRLLCCPCGGTRCKWRGKKSLKLRGKHRLNRGQKPHCLNEGGKMSERRGKKSQTSLNGEEK